MMDAQIILLEDYPCKRKDQLTARERYYIENTAHVVNKNIPTETSKEYHETHKEKIRNGNLINKEYIMNHRRNYYKKNRETIGEKMLKKYECECGGNY